MNGSVAQKVLLGITVVAAALYAVGGIAIAIQFMTDSPVWAMIVYSAVPIAAATLVIAGLLIAKRSPWFGVGLLAVGTVSVALVWFWMFMITVPVALLVIGFGVYRARRFARERHRVAPA